MIINYILVEVSHDFIVKQYTKKSKQSDITL